MHSLAFVQFYYSYITALCESVIAHPSGACEDLPDFPLGSISYSFEIFPAIGGRPYGTLATYTCTSGRLVGIPTRPCVNGAWLGIVPTCGTVGK